MNTGTTGSVGAVVDVVVVGIVVDVVVVGIVVDVVVVGGVGSGCSS